MHIVYWTRLIDVKKLIIYLVVYHLNIIVYQAAPNPNIDALYVSSCHGTLLNKFK